MSRWWTGRNLPRMRVAGLYRPGVPEGMRTAEGWVRVAVAACVAATSAWMAWVLAGTQFASAPRLTGPGVVLVVAERTTSAISRPFFVNVDVAVGRPRIAMDISITQNPSVPAPAHRSAREPAFPVLVFLCGRIAQDPQFRDNHGRILTWHQPDTGTAVEWTSAINGFLSTCVYSRQVLPEDSTTSFRQILLLGTADAPTERVSGTRIQYALPGVGTMPDVGDLPVAPLPAGSTASINLLGYRSDLTDAVASPQLPDTGILSWSADLTGTKAPAHQYRLSGTLQDVVATSQRNLFIAGALVGVAGGAIVWLTELILDAGSLGVRSRSMRRRSTPVTDNGGPDIAAGKRSSPDGVTPAQSLAGTPPGALSPGVAVAMLVFLIWWVVRGRRAAAGINAGVWRRRA